MLREYVIGEAMHALGIPTTPGAGRRRDRRAGRARDARCPARCSRGSRPATCASARSSTPPRAATPTLLRRLADYAIARHYPDAAEAEHPYLALLRGASSTRRPSLVARWMLVGFIHGVMNTDNMTISGETIDYGPCAFMDAYDPATVFSSIDHGGRYAYGNQPAIAQWNLARLAETLLPLFDADTPTAVERRHRGAEHVPRALPTGTARDGHARQARPAARDGSTTRGLLDDLLDAAARPRRRLHDVLPRAGGVPARRRRARAGAVRRPVRLRRVARALARRLPPSRRPRRDRRRRWTASTRVYIPRNHLVEEALAAATAGDLEPFERLVDVLARPFDERPGLEAYAEPAPATFGPYRTFCGT